MPKPERACVRAYHRDTRTRGAIKTWLSERGVEPRTVRVEVPYGTIFQVYREPLGTAEVARAELERLKARGIRDALVIRTGVLKHGIALGAYRREADARNRVAELGSQGVVAGFRTQNPTRRQDWLRFRIGAEERARLEADFSGLKLEPAEGCARP
ncbi:MAG: SPOR domain-containing protein [Gammaproteobacteria bacterium]